MTLKNCPMCRLDKSSEEFGKNKSHPDGLQTYCKSCTKIVNAEYYKRTPEKNDARNASRVKSRAKAQQIVWDHLASNPCVDCGEVDPVVLEFDHVRGDKSFNLSEVARRALHIDTILLEISKCEVRCANCHRRVTARRGGWYAYVNTVIGGADGNVTREAHLPRVPVNS